MVDKEDGNTDDSIGGSSLVLGLFGGLFVIWLVYRLLSRKAASPSPSSSPSTGGSTKKKPKGQQKKPQQPTKQKVDKNEDCLYNLTESKSAILAVAHDPKGHYVATVGEDRLVRLYVISSLSGNRTVYRINFEGDFATHCCFAPDGNYLVVVMSYSKEIHAYKIFKKKNPETGKIYELAKTFPHKHLKGTITNIQFSSNSQHILTCDNDTLVHIWNMKGEITSTLNTKQMKNYMAWMSPDCQLITAATFMNGVKIWRVKRTKEGLFLGVDEHHFTQLIGHVGSVFTVAFTSDSKKVITSGKDCTWRVWDLNVDFRLEQTPKLLSSTEHEGQAYLKTAISLDDSVFAAITGWTIHLWDIKSAKLLKVIEKAHPGEIMDLCFMSNNLLITSGSDGSVRVWKDPSA